MPRDAAPADIAALLRPGLDLPRPKSLRAVEWRAVDEKVMEARHPKTGAWVRGPMWRGDVLDGLAAGEDYYALVARYVKRHPDEKYTRWADDLVRRYLVWLHDAGAIDLALAEAPASLPPRYQLEKLLGRGGFGVAWLARDRDADDAPVVVKSAWGYYHAPDVSEAVIRNEAAVARALDHPGIARMLDTFEVAGRLHLVRAFVEGAPLSHETKRRAPRDVLADALAIADILEHLHARGFLALDLGPANFLRRASDGRVVMIDVGMCHAHVDGAAKLEHLVGNRGYVSPEVRKTRDASVRSDVWSVGRLIVAFSTRIPPKDSWTGAEGAALVTDPTLRALVLRFTQPDPADRPQSMRAAADEMRAALASLS